MRRQWNDRADLQAKISGGVNLNRAFHPPPMVQECLTPQTVKCVPICEDRIKSRLNVKSNCVMSSSIRNRLPGIIEKIVSDKVVSEIVIRTAAGEVTSVITTGSVQRMNLKEGDQVFAMIKATEVSVEKE
jgi:molybdopterin-binding protein